MVNWCNLNQGFLMVLLTFIYVVATITICYINYRVISEQRTIYKNQSKIATFSLRYETFKTIQEELHFWRFSNNDQVKLFFDIKTKVDLSLLMASHNQNFFNILTSAKLVFGEDVYERLNEAWGIIRERIYPVVSNIVSQASPQTSPVDILISIKHKLSEAPFVQYKDRLFTLELEISCIIDQKIGIKNI